MLKSQTGHILTDLSRRRFGLLRMSVVLSLALHLVSGEARAVPAVPNESLVYGEILEVDVIDSTSLDIRPKRKLWRLKLRLIKVDGIEGKNNFLRAAEDQTVEVYTADDTKRSAAVGQKVKGRISFRGDERSGRYWIVGTLETVPQ